MLTSGVNMISNVIELEFDCIVTLIVFSNISSRTINISNNKIRKQIQISVLN